MLNRDISGFTSRDDRRVFFLSSLATMGFVALVVRLFFLQVVRGIDMERQAQMNSTQILPFLAPRGLVMVRNGSTEEAVLENAPRFSLFYSDSQKFTASHSLVENELIGRLPKFEPSIRRKMSEAKKTGKITRILTNIPSPVALALMERRIFLPGVNVLVEPQRRARFGSFACHLLGYAGEVDEVELKRGRDASLRPGQWVGKNGLEKVFDGLLRGVDGGLEFEVDAVGRHLQVVRRIPSTPGNDLHLTIDRRLQSVAEAGLAGSWTGRGAAVALDPRSGAVLVLASTPGYDPSGNLGDYLGNEDLPFFNRAVQGVYPPGSVFKIVTAAAALENTGWNIRQSFLCTGSYALGDREFGCWGKHGQRDFLGAMAMSCDVYFYHLGKAIGPDLIEATAKAFGFGEKTGLDIPGESLGLVPGRSWKKRTLRQGWFDGDTLNYTIGQGALTVTPLQTATFMAALANEGTVWRPYVVESVVSPEKKIIFQHTPEARRRVVLRPEVWTMLRRSAEVVVTQGTGGVVKRLDLVVGAKTGTAQNPHGEDHSWFAAYAGRPGEPAGIALVVFVENGGHGSAAAGPIARAILDQWAPPPAGVSP